MSTIKITSGGTSETTRVIANGEDVTESVVRIEILPISRGSFVSAIIEFSQVELDIIVSAVESPEAD